MWAKRGELGDMRQEKRKPVRRRDRDSSTKEPDKDRGGLTAGSPIQIQAIQSEIQTVVDAGTAVSKAKEGLQKKIKQSLQQDG